MKYTTYILFSKRIQKYYTGQTEALDRRIEEHNYGKTPFLKSGMPWILLFSQEFNSRAEAMALEKKIKKRGAKRFLSDNGYNVG